MIVTQTNIETAVCLTCGAVVARKLAQSHEDWHTNIAAVAIEQAKQLDQLKENRRAHAQDD